MTGSEPFETAGELVRVLARIALACGDGGRDALLRQLPEPLAAAVRDALRRPQALHSASSPVEAAVAAVLPPASGIQAAEDADGDGPDDAQGEPAPAAADREPATRLPELLLGHLLQGPPSVAAVLLGSLPPALQGRAMIALATGTPASSGRILTADEAPVLAQLTDQLDVASMAWGVRPACRILRALDSTRQLQRAMTAAAEADESAALILQSYLFTFDDLVRLRDPELQVLLGRIDNATLAQAMTDCGDAVRQRLLDNVSGRRVTLLEEEAERYAEVTGEEVERARAEVLSVVRLLYERGRIATYFGSIRRPGEVAEASDEDPENPPRWREEAPPHQEDDSGPRASPPAGGHRRLALRLLAGSLLAAVLVLAASQLGPGDGAQRSATGRQRPTETGGQGRLLVRTPPSSDSAAAARTGASASLRPGERLQVADGADAILEFPAPAGGAAAEARIDAGSLVEGLGPEQQTSQPPDSTRATSLYLRAGRVTVTVLDEGFVLRTPVAELTASPGSVFTVRVVLDATTTAANRKGHLWVRSTAGELARPAPGQQARVDGAGRVRLSP